MEREMFLVYMRKCKYEYMYSSKGITLDVYRGLSVTQISKDLNWQSD